MLKGVGSARIKGVVLSPTIRICLMAFAVNVVSLSIVEAMAVLRMRNTQPSGVRAARLNKDGLMVALIKTE